MHWIALLPSEGERAAWGWHALQFTPRVAVVDEALVLEVSGSLRLWGGLERFSGLFFESNRALPLVESMQGATSLIAIALLRLHTRAGPQAGAPGWVNMPTLPDSLPLATLSAALPHVATLERTGCRTWGQLRALPRGGVARRFGAALLAALDAAYGERPEVYPWLTLPEVFDVRLELPALATGAPELMWTAQRLLVQLQVWLRARQRGVLALELEWALDLKRLDGVALPSHEQLVVRTAQPAQDMAHLRRLVGEQLARVQLAAPVNQLRLRSLETAPWVGASQGFLPEDKVQGDRLHQFIERLSARLGEHNVTVPQAQADHRPECKQRWVPARSVLGPGGALKAGAQANTTSAATSTALQPDALYPTWLLPEPLRLQVHQHVPQYGGPLRRLARLYRLETGWWEAASTTQPTSPMQHTQPSQGLALRDYFIAQSPQAGLVWIYRERPVPPSPEQPGLPEQAPPREFRWYLQGLYA